LLTNGASGLSAVRFTSSGIESSVWASRIIRNESACIVCTNARTAFFCESGICADPMTLRIV